MNVLVPMLRERRELVGEVGAQEDAVSLRELSEMIDLPARFRRGFADTLLRDTYMARLLPSEVAEALMEAPAGPGPPARLGHWVTAVTAPWSGALVMPDDASPTERMIAFYDYEGTTQRIALEPAPNGGTTVSITTGGHCPEPTRRRCAHGACGECELVQIADGEDLHWACRCPHS